MYFIICQRRYHFAMSYKLKKCKLLRRYLLAIKLHLRNNEAILLDDNYSLLVPKCYATLWTVTYFVFFFKLINCIYKCAYVKGIGYTEVKINGLDVALCFVQSLTLQTSAATACATLFTQNNSTLSSCKHFRNCCC